MLKKLHIEQFVIIDTLDIDLESGLTIITGETGAGKSIILGALGLMLGEQSNPKSIRQGSDKSIIQATFSLEDQHYALPLLREMQLLNDNEKEFSVHRVIKTDGSETVELNGKPIEVEDLKKVGEVLTEIHGQHANHTLLGPENQLNLLDLCGNFGQVYFDNVSNALDDVKKYTIALKDEKEFLMKYKGLQLKKLEDVNKKFDSVGMKEGFLKETKEEYATLLTAKETMEAFQSIQGRLIAGNGVVVSLAAANNTLADQKNVEAEKVQKLAEYLDLALSNARNAVEEMNTVSPEYEIDLAPLENLKKVLTTLKEIAMDAKINFDDVEAYWVDQSTKLKRVQAGRERIAELKNLLAEANAVTDNPLIFCEEKEILAGGNFHAELVAFAADNLALAIAEIAAIAERRIALLIDGN